MADAVGIFRKIVADATGKIKLFSVMSQPTNMDFTLINRQNCTVSGWYR